MKGPPTEEDLLQLGNTSSLQKITSLNLSRRNITSISTELFNQLVSLQSLDLSQNMLTEIPADLDLPKLHTLDVSDNQLDSVKFVQQFDKLENLYLEDNEDIMLEDYYIAKVMCPSLRSIDGAEDVKHIEKGISLYHEQLLPAIEAVWEAQFEEVYSNGVNQEEIDSLLVEFVNTINKGNIVGSNLSMPKLKAFMISHLCRGLLEDVNAGKNKSKSRSARSAAECNVQSPYRTRVSKGTVPCKDYSSGTPVSKGKTSPSEASKQTKSNLKKRKREDSLEELSPIKSPAAKRTKNVDVTPDFTQIRQTNPADEKTSQLPGLPDYEPHLFLRCHSRENNPADNRTKVWNCAFEPLIGKQGETSNVLATCGGKIVCFIDCQTGKVLKRYKDSSKSESFYSLAWTTLPADGKHLKEDVNILAVGGDDHVIKLIDPTQLVMFGTLTGHRGWISSLVFHPTRPNILFSSSRDKRIIMWDIGTPDYKDYSVTWKQKATLSFFNTDAICLKVNADLDLLVAGCEKSCFAWKLNKLYSPGKHVNIPADCEFVQPQLDDDDEDIVVDSLALLSNNLIVSKCVDQNRLYIWDLQTHIEGSKRPTKPRVIPVSPLVQLQYISTDVDYLYLNSMHDVLSVGDNKGNVYMYNLKSVVRKKKACEELLRPSQILEFPEIVIDAKYEDKMKDVTERQDVVVNCVAQSSSGDYLVCGTDNNLLCIWKRV